MNIHDAVAFAEQMPSFIKRLEAIEAAVMPVVAVVAPQAVPAVALGNAAAEAVAGVAAGVADAVDGKPQPAAEPTLGDILALLKKIAG